MFCFRKYIRQVVQFIFKENNKNMTFHFAVEGLR